MVFLTAGTAARGDVAAMEARALGGGKGEIMPRALARSLRYAMKQGEMLGAWRQRATRDPRAGLLDRREFDLIPTEEEERGRGCGHPLALVMTDVDPFKAVNDPRGHPMGDAGLREVARRVAGLPRAADRLARSAARNWRCGRCKRAGPRCWTSRGGCARRWSRGQRAPASGSGGASR